MIDFTAVDSARPLLRRRMPVRVHIGSAEVLGQLRFVRAVSDDKHSTPAQLLLWKHVVFYPGQRIIVRRMSPKDLLGGAVVRGTAREQIGHDIRTEHDGDRAATLTAATHAMEAEFGDAPGSSEVLELLAACALTPVGAARMAARTNLAQPVVETALAWLLEQGRIAIVRKPDEYVSRSAFDEALTKLERALHDSHERAPWRLGLQTAEVARLLEVPEGTASRLLQAWHDDGRVVMKAGFWHAPGFLATLTRSQKSFFETALPVDPQAPYLPNSYAEIAARAAQTSSDTVEALGSMVAAGAFVRVGDDLYRRSQLDRAQAAIAERLRDTGSATMAQLRDVLGTSRKYALPLMEHFDSIGFTMRDGDLRRLRKVK
jgi:selenocysteine-specific elongation factor